MSFLYRFTRESFLSTLIHINRRSFMQRRQNIVTSICVLQNGETAQLYPTNNVCVRELRSSSEARTKIKNGVKNGLSQYSNTPLKKFIVYHLKLLFYMFHDNDVEAQVDASLNEGVTMAFLFISECLLAKKYKDLEEVLTPELIQKVQQGSISCPVAVEEVLQLELVDINWRRFINIYTYDMEKHIAVDVALIYSPAVAVGELLEKNMFAVLRFHRIFSEDVKNPRWIVSDICYVNSISRFRILFQLNKLKMKHW